MDRKKMSDNNLIYPLTKSSLPVSAGNKACNVNKLRSIGMNTPVSYACSWKAHERYLKQDPRLDPTLTSNLEKIIDPNKKYAVRSSASIEDQVDRSFAGQFTSELDIQGTPQVLRAIHTVWDSAQLPEVHTYMDRYGIPADHLQMAVLIQEMVEPAISGVAFSKNPLTGTDEIVIEGCPGLGKQLVQDGVTPERWVNKWGYWLEKPENPLIPANLIDRIVEETKLIARKLKQKVDLEWVWNGKDLYWVQVREITTLKPLSVFSNYLPKEFLPGIIKPLIFSINSPMMCSLWVGWIEEMTGELGIKPEDLARSIYYRAYFNMGIMGNIFTKMGFPRESMEMLMGYIPKGQSKMSFKPSLKTISLMPRMVVGILKRLNLKTKIRKALPRLSDEILRTPYRDLAHLSDAELIEKINKHFKLVQEAATYNTLGQLVMRMFGKVFESQLNKHGVEIADFDLTAGIPGFLEYNPNTHLCRLNKEFLALPTETQERVLSSSYENLRRDKNFEKFVEKVDDFIEHFGYLSDNNNDFSAVPWREKPEMIIKLFSGYEEACAEKKERISMEDLRKQRKVSRSLLYYYKQTRDYVELREQIGGLYTHAYGLFRYFFLELGRRFTDRSILGSPEDIFLLTYPEVKEIVNGNGLSIAPHQIVNQHKVDMERYRDIILPSVIFGDEVPPVREPDMDMLSGIPASIGNYTGPVKVVRGMDDFNLVKEGDVLVIPYSDVGWTPLFTRAGAVIAESGGQLSHSAIVAREYGIPAVVSVPNALASLADDMVVTVNGHKGEIYIHHAINEEVLCQS